MKMLREGSAENLRRALTTGHVVAVVGWDGMLAPEMRTARTNGGFTAAGLASALRSPQAGLADMYRALARLPIEAVISITPDPVLPRLLEREDPRWLRLGASQIVYPDRRRIYIPLCGDLDDPETAL